MKKQIVILGGGFAGLYTALEFERTLARDDSFEVTLVNHDNFFLFTPMLHEVAASDLDITHIVNPIRKLLRRVRFFQGDCFLKIWFNSPRSGALPCNTPNPEKELKSSRYSVNCRRGL